MKGSGAWQRTVTAAKGQEEEVRLGPGFPHTNTSPRERKRDWSPSGEQRGAGPSEPGPRSATHVWVTVTTRDGWDCPWSTSAPTQGHSRLLPSLLPATDVDSSTSGEAKEPDTPPDPAAASASTEEPGEA